MRLRRRQGYALKNSGDSAETLIEPLRTLSVCRPIVCTTENMIHKMGRSLPTLSRQGSVPILFIAKTDLIEEFGHPRATNHIREIALQRRRCRRSHEKLWRRPEVLGRCRNQFRAIISFGQWRIGNPHGASRFLSNDVDVIESIGVPGGIRTLVTAVKAM